MDIHHILNHTILMDVKGYSGKNTLSIALSTREHYLLSKGRRKKSFYVQESIEEELIELVKYTNIPSDVIKLIRKKISHQYES